jgi:CHAT domain-containing protein
MPWECLAWDGATLFGERFAVNSLTSLSLGLELQQEHYRPAAQHLRARLVATLLGKKELRGSDAGGGDLADDDAERLLRPYARHADEALLNERATRRRAMVVPPGLDVLHFLAHGGRDDAADAAGLALTPAADDDGLLGATDAETMQVPGVVILSACGLGRSHARLGDDPLVGTLGGAFLAAGAHTVVQSSADLRLRSQLALWEQVHAELAHGAATATALRTVRARLAGSSSLVTRFEYAQVQVFGLGHLPLLR